VTVIKHVDYFQIYIFTETPNNKGASEFTYDELRKIPSKFRIWWNVKEAFSGRVSSVSVDGNSAESLTFEMTEKWSEYTYALKW
jgi:hypothetical protein